MDFKICIWTSLGVVHQFVLKNHSESDMMSFRKYFATSNAIEFTHRETGHVTGFMRVNIVNYTFEQIQGGEDVRDQYDTGAQ